MVVPNYDTQIFLNVEIIQKKWSCDLINVLIIVFWSLNIKLLIMDGGTT